MDKNVITAAIGNANMATLFLVEHLMAAERGELSGLSKDELRTLARKSYAKAKAMAEAGQIRGYCKTHNLTVPPLLWK